MKKLYRKRYVYVAVEKAEAVTDANLMKALRNHLEHIFGLTVLHLSRLKLEKAVDGKKFILSVNNCFLKEAIAAITFVGRAGEEDFVLNILGIESTMKKLLNKVSRMKMVED